MLVIVLIICVFFGAMTALVAGKKNRSEGAWFLYGTVFPPALIHALLIDSRSRSTFKLGPDLQGKRFKPWGDQYR